MVSRTLQRWGHRLSSTRGQQRRGSRQAHPQRKKSCQGEGGQVGEAKGEFVAVNARLLNRFRSRMNLEMVIKFRSKNKEWYPASFEGSCPAFCCALEVLLCCRSPKVTVNFMLLFKPCFGAPGVNRIALKSQSRSIDGAPKKLALVHQESQIECNGSRQRVGDRDHSLYLYLYTSTTQRVVDRPPLTIDVFSNFFQ